MEDLAWGSSPDLDAGITNRKASGRAGGCEAESYAEWASELVRRIGGNCQEAFIVETAGGSFFIHSCAALIQGTTT